MNLMNLKPFIGQWVLQDLDNPHILYRAMPDDIYLIYKKINDDQTVISTVDNNIIITHNNRKCQLIEIKRIPFQIRIQELTRLQALQCIHDLIQFTMRCIKRGVVPMDTHEGNLIYDKRIYFIDLDAFRAQTNITCGNTFARILYLYYKYVLRRPIRTYETFGFQAIKSHGGWAAKQTTRDFTKLDVWIEFLDIVDNTIKRGEIQHTKSHWNDEYATNLDVLANSEKFLQTQKLMQHVNGKTLLDIGCNKGYFCEMMANKFEIITGFDPDENCINYANKNFNNQHINYACFGLQHFYDKTDHMPIEPRYQADVISVLALTHHLEKAKIPADIAASIFIKLAKCWILIEDIECVQVYIKKFKEAGFGLIETVKSYPSSRTLSLWKRQ